MGSSKLKYNLEANLNFELFSFDFFPAPLLLILSSWKLLFAFHIFLFSPLFGKSIMRIDSSSRSSSLFQ